MAGDGHLGERGLWSGLSYIGLGLVALWFFEFHGDSATIAEVIPCLALVGIGVADALAPRLSPLFADLNRYWTGLFWSLCGLGIVGLAVVSSGATGRWLSGIVLGGGLVLYGLFVAADW
ncbi:hypothetical protein EL22_15235 [Halostagnicola sp. A56]|uniref:hypothetical protein n=1 Tax=Halostagnicola sp. A56 TaxID=1495067 RepID=UPI0004A0C971|nr:hypothetical protein [Halostagnicola sp. A56]KDE59931.1 hypothetical protein EL22_15235 [Halostagnicola sp. A56]